MYVANYLPVSAVSFTDCKCYSDGIYGCLGLICVKDETFLVLVTQIDNIGIFNGKTIYRITDVSFISLNNDLYDYCLDKKNLQALVQDEEGNSGLQNHPCNDLIKYLSRGTFYYSNEFDLSNCAQNRFNEVGTKKSSYLESANGTFFWNKYLLKELLNFRKHLLDIEKFELDRSGILLVVIQGFVSISNIRTTDEEAQMCLISRLSCKRVGTRYNTRGIDDDGNVANFVESEILFHNNEYYFSFLQIRGSVPVFWEQPQTAQMTHKIELSRGMESTAPAFKRHFEKIIKKYGNVYIINLLSKKEGTGENILGQEFEKHFINSPESIKSYLKKYDFDFHEQYKSGEYKECEDILININNDLDNYSYFLMKKNEIVSKQLGVVRSNCLDCLDRTNVVQSYIALHIFRKFFLNEKNLNYCSLVYGDENFKTVFKNIWADNGDILSRIYAGTGALKSSITRKGKQTVLGYLNDAKKSINRFVNNAFFDKSRQETINLLLGRFDNQKNVILHDPLSDTVQNKLQEQMNKFSSRGSISIFAGTWNVNGQPPPNNSDEDIYQWLSPDDEKLPDVYVIGIEEIVELTPQQVMSTDPEKRKKWEMEILNILRKFDPSYIHLKSKQLVGAFIAIFVRDKDVDKIRNIESVLIKTGLKGLAGNKGGVAISMNYYDSSLCFVTAHLAAGQQNIEDRNRDYHTISEGINFKGGRKIKDHDIVIWIGDFNYRINNLSNEYVRQKAIAGDLDELLNNDQLINQMLEGKAFYGYQEGPITFRPTYKYDIGTDEFDTSEKARIPAWCDRVLFKANRINQRYYKSTSNLRISDHKPVKSLFDVEITIVDKETKRKIEKELYEEQLDLYKRGQANGMIYKINPFLDDESNDIEMYLEQRKPSTETYHWWDLRFINKSPDTYSISSNDSYRTDISVARSFNSTYTAINNSYTGSNLINEITTLDSSITYQASESNSRSKPVNPFVFEFDEQAEQPIKTHIKSHQQQIQRKRDSLSSASNSRKSSIYSDSNNGSKNSSLIKPLSSINNSSNTNGNNKLLTTAIPIISSPPSSTFDTPKPSRSTPKSPNKLINDKETSSSEKDISSSKSTAHQSYKPESKSKTESSKLTTRPNSVTLSTQGSASKSDNLKLGNNSSTSSTTGTSKPVTNQVINKINNNNNNSTTTSQKIPSKPNSLVRSSTSNSVSSTNKIKPISKSSTTSSISSLINSFNNNSNKITDSKNASTSIAKAFTIYEKSDSPDENMIIKESNIKTHDVNVILNGRKKEKKLTKSTTLPDLTKDIFEDHKNNSPVIVNPQTGFIFNKTKQPPPPPIPPN
jgi:hypothetical protein